MRGAVAHAAAAPPLGYLPPITTEHHQSEVTVRTTAWYEDFVGSPEAMSALAAGDLKLPEWTSPDYVIDNLDEIPGRYEGHEGVARWARETFETFEYGWFELQEVVEISPDIVLAGMLVRGRMRTTELDPKTPFWAVHVYRDGLATYVKGYLSRDRAVEDAERWAAERASGADGNPGGGT